jgi:hypothetical protein
MGQRFGFVNDMIPEIARLQQAKSLLSGTSENRKAGRPKGSTTPIATKKRKMSPEGRARIVAAVKARWAKAKKAAK